MDDIYVIVSWMIEFSKNSREMFWDNKQNASIGFWLFNIEYFKLIRSLKQFNTTRRYLIYLINGVIDQSAGLSLHQWSAVSSGLSFTSPVIMQMSKNNCQFIINLVKLPNGYAFDSLLQPQIPPAKKKNPRKSGPQISTSKSMNRIARQLALNLQPPQEKLPTLNEHPENYPRPPQPEVQEEIQVDIQRQNGLPQSPAQWYDETKIHNIEVKTFPQFFGDKTLKASNLYMNYRNLIVNLYRKNPNQYLTKITCRRILRGNVMTILKIHSFLEKQGVINFGVFKDGYCSFNSSIFSKALNPQIYSPNPAQKMIDKDEEITHDSVDLTNLTVTLVNKNFSKGNRAYCSKCNMICGLIWYNKKDVTAEKTEKCLCCECFQELEDKQSQGYIKSDIIKKSQALSYKDNQNSSRDKPIWNIDENVKLLQFSSNCQSETWDRLKTQYQHKKSLEDIILQFMQFPITNFDENSERPPTTAVSYPQGLYVNKLVKRFESSSYNKEESDEMKEESEEEDVKFEQEKSFKREMQKIWEKIIEKYLTRISCQIKREDCLDKISNEIKKEVEIRKRSLLLLSSAKLEIIEEENQSKSQIKRRKKNRKSSNSEQYDDGQLSSDSYDSENDEQRDNERKEYKDQDDEDFNENNSQLNEMIEDVRYG